MFWQLVQTRFKYEGSGLAAKSEHLRLPGALGVVAL